MKDNRAAITPTILLRIRVITTASGLDKEMVEKLGNILLQTQILLYLDEFAQRTAINFWRNN